MDFTAFLSDLKTHARVEGDDEDAGLAAMLIAAGADVMHAAGLPVPEDVGDLPSDLKFAVIDQAAMLYDARGGDTDRPVGLSIAASRITHRYRGVRLDTPEATE